MDKVQLNRDSIEFLKIIVDREEQLIGKIDLTSLPINKARDIFLELLKPVAPLKPVEVLVNNTSFSYDSASIPLRIYTPSQTNQPLPALIFFHGGGFVYGNLDFIDYSCRLLANVSQCIVISVDYRKAPEYKFPVAHEDGYHAVRFIQENANQFGCNGKIAIGGESAGGNLAASICHKAKETNEISISAQILYYPWLNLNNNSASNKKFATGYLLETATLNWMRNQFLSNKELCNNPIASPLLQNNFNDLPPALILSAECDPIHDEAKLYFSKLVNADVPTQFIEFGGVLHGFFALPWHFEAAYLSFSMVREYLHHYL